MWNPRQKCRAAYFILYNDVIWARWRLKSPASRLFTQLFIPETSKPRVTGLCAGNSPVSCEFPAQIASNEVYVSIWWRYHVPLEWLYIAFTSMYFIT